MRTHENLQWEGIIDFSVLDQEMVRQKGLLDNIPALLEAIKNGDIQAKQYRTKNKVTNYVRSYLASVLSGTATMPLVLPSKMELGTGSGTPAATDTDLWSPSSATIKPISNTQVYLNYYAQYVCTWLTSDPIQGTWTEIGLKDANSNLWAHANVTGLPTVNSGEMLIGQWQVQIIGN